MMMVSACALLSQNGANKGAGVKFIIFLFKNQNLIKMRVIFP
ncbi:hypothetical protein DNO_0124 [Dichelobacter nodosus VCS1703A]|uniref:Uncharacterized protein n=1 Tax=Dichelobacter nodosus (strain VCS1703A) TaxID=246195 RepID=A5EWP2_DICNV|nr:hypothetical protein DNO_0124 [Dichelobacter nodosus VCS1703A]